MKNSIMIKYIRVCNFLFNIIIFAFIIIFAVSAENCQNIPLFILGIAVIILIKKIIYNYWMKTAYSFAVENDKVTFYCGKRQKIYLRLDCNKIEEKDSEYIFYFSDGSKIRLRKIAKNCEFKKNTEVNYLNFPNAFK